MRAWLSDGERRIQLLKQEKRARICMLLIVALLAGLLFFLYEYSQNRSDWATFYGNTQLYTEGVINRGTVTDRNDVELLKCSKEGYHYNEDYSTRVSTVHAVGDINGNIPSGAINMFKSQLIGYDLLNGTFDVFADGKKITLTLDSGACAKAYEALDGRAGTVGVYNWKTGEILCMVSTPSFDPEDMSGAEDSCFFNNFIDGALTPGSTFKLVTSAAVIDNMPDRNSFEFYCDGVNQLGDSEDSNLTDVYPHGTVDFKSALAQSCNGAFGALSRNLGADILNEYTEKVGLTKPVHINGIETASGSFSFPKNNELMLSWAGVGQGQDLVNPCAMMVYMGAIANKGVPVEPSIIKNATFLKTIKGGKDLDRYLSKSTASELKKMMKNNVVEGYGEDNFEGLDIYAKSGTAETGSWSSDAWFVGFTDDRKAPYAFVVWIKNGGFGSEAAAPVANEVLQYLKNNS